MSATYSNGTQMLKEKHNEKPELSRPQLFKDIITSEEEKHKVLQEPVLNMRDAKYAILTHRSLLAGAERYVFGTKDKGTKL